MAASAAAFLTLPTLSFTSRRRPQLKPFASHVNLNRLLLSPTKNPNYPLKSPLAGDPIETPSSGFFGTPLTSYQCAEFTASWGRMRRRMRFSCSASTPRSRSSPSSRSRGGGPRKSGGSRGGGPRKSGGRFRRFPPIDSGDRIHYSNISLLSRFISEQGKILSRRVNRLSLKQQRAITAAIKQARILSLLPFLNNEKQFERTATSVSRISGFKTGD